MALISFRECFSEFVGVMALVYFCGWVLIREATDSTDTVAVAMVHAAVLTAMTYLSAARSACHFNPSITLGRMATGDLEPVRAGFYFVAQFVGAFVGAIFLTYTVPHDLQLRADANGYGVFLGVPRVGQDVGWLAVCFLELFGTVILTITYSALADEKKLESFAPALGCMYGLCIMCLGEYNGTSFNPFRYLGPALCTLKLSSVLIYTLPSLVGGVLGAFIYDYVFKTVKYENIMAQQQLSKIE